MNSDAQPLQLHEIKAITADKACLARVVKSYSLMLDFYGFRLCNEETGEIERADNWKKRFRNLCHSSHNWLRVTRILKSLGELGFEHYKLPFLVKIAHECFVTKELLECKTSLLNYWSMTLREKNDQYEMQKVIQKYCPERTVSYVSREDEEKKEEEDIEDEENPDDESFETKNAPNL